MLIFLKLEHDCLKRIIILVWTAAQLAPNLSVSICNKNHMYSIIQSVSSPLPPSALSLLFVLCIWFIIIQIFIWCLSSSRLSLLHFMPWNFYQITREEIMWLSSNSPSAVGNCLCSNTSDLCFLWAVMWPVPSSCNGGSVYRVKFWVHSNLINQNMHSNEDHLSKYIYL